MTRCRIAELFAVSSGVVVVLMAALFALRNNA